MPLGYDKPLYILPFDHRHSYGTEVFGYHEPMTAAQIADVAASKQLIYDGFKLAIERGVSTSTAGILVDEEFGAAILRDAAQQHYLFAISTEKSGQHEFDFEYGDQFEQHIEGFRPTFAKVLVRYNAAGDRKLNQRQSERLRRISDYLATSTTRFMFELLVPPEPDQLEKLGGDATRFDTELRPTLVVAAIEELQDRGIDPDVWKIEGLESRSDCEHVASAAQRQGRNRVGCIVLGRGESSAKVIEWLRIAAAVTGFIGFAVGRSTFLDAIIGWHGKTMSRSQACEQIAARYQEWIRIYSESK